MLQCLHGNCPNRAARFVAHLRGVVGPRGGDFSAALVRPHGGVCGGAFLAAVGAGVIAIALHGAGCTFVSQRARKSTGTARRVGSQVFVRRTFNRMQRIAVTFDL